MTPRPESSTNSHAMPLPHKYDSSQRYPTLSDHSSSTQSQSIPMVLNQLLKTHSELQLCMDEALAEQKDYMFFSRVLKGISDSQDCIHSYNFRVQNQSLVSHIIHTRRQDVERRPQYEDLDDDDDDDWTLGLSSIEPYSSRAAAELDGYNEGIFDLEL